jgi:hypothetical protein
MNNTEALAAQIAQLTEVRNQLDHDCGPSLLLCLRTVEGGGRSLVQQCTVCGRQRGGAHKKTGARADTPDFDTGLEVAFNGRRRAVDEELRAAQDALISLTDPMAANRRAEFRASLQADREASAAQLTQARQALDGAMAAILALNWQRRLPFVIDHLQRNHSASFLDPQPVPFVPFETEGELRGWLDPVIERDFEVVREVRGRHLTEQARVQIDYLLIPRAHLIAQGFKPEPMGLEVKYLPLDHGFSPRASRFIWQAVSYTDCEFELRGQTVRLSHVLLFSNLSFGDELHQLRGASDSPLANDRAKWTALLELANHANVANLQMFGSRARSDGWKITFATGVYFSRYRESLRLHNRQLAGKVRIGNF